MVLDAEIEAIRYSNQLPSYRMWHDLEPRIEDVRKSLAHMWNADPNALPSRGTPANRFRSRSLALTSHPATKS